MLHQVLFSLAAQTTIGWQAVDQGMCAVHWPGLGRHLTMLHFHHRQNRLLFWCQYY